jgi:hypothetical protein
MKIKDIESCEQCPIGEERCSRIIRGNYSYGYNQDPPCVVLNEEDEITEDMWEE